jgi:DNA-3-methyladenine glycosylase
MNQINLNNKLPKIFYSRNVLTVAKELLGKIFVKNVDNQLYAGKIVEVEAYDGSVDEAAHSFSGLTKRNEIMFKEGGYLYVYFTYGVHFCCNVVTGKKGEGKAVLLRGIEPLEGIKLMALNRFGRKNITEKEKRNLTSGPGKTCRAFSIIGIHNGMDLTGDKIFILNNDKIKKNKIITTPRIGITKSTNLPWRFYIKNNPFVSQK